MLGSACPELARYGENSMLAQTFGVRSLDATPRFQATDLHSSRQVVGAPDAEHIGKVYEGFCRQRMPATASL